MENDLLEAIFEAITVGDETNLRRCLQRATIDTVLEFQRAYGESPLHLCVKIGGMSHLGVVRCLLASRLFDSTAVDGEGLTALECALKNGDDELVEALIKIEIDGLDDATACYQMLRYDSLEIFKKYLLVRQYPEEDEFQPIASALIRLNVTNVPLSEALRHYTQWKLSDYGFRALSGNWTGAKDSNEWKTHIEIVSDCWRVISERHDTRLYDDADDMFLHRLQTVHNHLYFLKHKQFLAHLPMQEATFCVAIFLSIFRNPTQFSEYRLMVNKCMVIEFVRMVSQQLAIVRKYLEGTETDLLAIVRQAEAAGVEAKDRLIGDLLSKMESSESLPNRAHVMKQLKERVTNAGGSNRDSIIKDMLDKMKKIDKSWMETKAEELKALDRVCRERLIEQIGKRLRHVSHPQNVVNRLMGDWKKGKPTDTIVADIVSGESFNLCHLMRGKDRRIKRKLLKCYRITRQHYSLHKIVFYCKNIESMPTPDMFKPATLADIASLKRSIQVLGEAIKNTANSANMPVEAEGAVNSMLTALFPDISKLLREVFSHSISLKKLMQGESYDVRLCASFHTHMGMMQTAFQLLYAVTVTDVRQTFYGHMRQCDTFRELRSLVLYAGDNEDLEKRQFACYLQVKEYFDEAKVVFEQLENEPIGQTPTFRHLSKQLEVKREIVRQLGNHFKENDGVSYHELQRACLYGDDLSAIRRLLDWKLTMGWAGKFFRKVRTSWQTNHVESLTLEWQDHRLLKYNPSVIAGMLKIASSGMECSEEFDYIESTRQLAVELNIADKLDEEALQQLNKRLRSYYSDIFFVDNKWKVLEVFCKERKLPWNKENARKLVKCDQELLQHLYDSRRKKLRAILEQHRLHTVDGLVTRLYEIPTRVLSSIEYLQLELCEMLLAVGYFGDNFHYLKHRIPMIQGRNYRNFLAHDQLSYNLLTDSWMEKVVINAFVFANNEVRLFGNHQASSGLKLNVPTVHDAHRWVERQQQLLATFQARNVERMHAIAQDGGEIKAKFCCSQNKTYLPSAYCLLPELINPCRFDKPTIEYLNLFFSGFKDQCNNPAYQVRMALTMRDFQAAFDRTIAHGDTHVHEELLDWEDLMPQVRKTGLFVHLVAAFNRGRILSKLIEHGNERGVRELLPFFETFNSSNDRGPLGDAMLYCSRSIADLLLPRSTAPHPAILLLAIILQWNDIFTHMMAQVGEINEPTFQFLLRTTAQARNYTATVYLLENEGFRSFVPGAFVSSAKLAASMGERAILQHLIERCRTPDSTMLAKILHQAAVKHRWQCVELFLQYNVPVDVVVSDNLSEEKCTLLVLVKYGACRLLQKIKSVKQELFGTIATHPFAVAVRNGMASKRMIRTLRTLGFDWLDSSAALHAAIRNGKRNILKTIRKLVDEQCAVNVSSNLDHFQQALSVLHRWKMISFVEESTVKTYGSSSLFCAVQSKDQAMVRELFSWGRQMRTIDDGEGILGGIAFERESMFTCFGKKTNNRFWITGDCCKDMIVRMETCAMLGEMMIWQQFTVDTTSTPVTFHVLTACDETIEQSLEKLPFTLRDSVSLLEHLEDFLAFANTSLSSYDIVFAKFSTETGATRCFWQIEQISCMYDILPTSANETDLADMINYRDSRGETALHHCFPNDTLEMVKLLVENGANPLLADSSDLAAIHLSMLNSQDFAVARYLFDECIRRDLRNEKGCSVLDLDDGIGGNRLIHTAVMTGRPDIIQRLLEHRVDVSKVNAYGITPAQLAASVISFNSHRMVKMILDYDSSSINTKDKHDCTLLRYAVKEKSAELTELVLKYKPDLSADCGGLTPLGYAIVLNHVECAKSILKYAIENNIRGITQEEDCDMILLSLMINNYELSRMLLEYELDHTLEEVDERDLPRIKSILEGTIPERPDVTVAQVVQRYDESQKFLQELLLFATSVTASD